MLCGSALLLNCLPLWASQRITCYPCQIMHPYVLSIPSKCKDFWLLLSVFAFLSLSARVCHDHFYFCLCLSVLLKWGWLRSFSVWSAQRNCLACGRGFHRWVKCIGWSVHFLWSPLTVWSHNSISVLISDISPILHLIATVDRIYNVAQTKMSPVRNIITYCVD